MRRFTIILAACVLAACATAVPAIAATPVASTSRVQWAKTEAWHFWMVRGAAILASFRSGSAAGQCTEMAAIRRPDIITRVDLWVYIQDVLRASSWTPPYVQVDWLAKAWVADARMAGIHTGHRPRRGAVMVFQPGAYGAGWGGHVAVVESVSRNGAFTISEMHAPLLGVISRRRFARTTERAMAKDRRIAFIYG